MRQAYGSAPAWRRGTVGIAVYTPLLAECVVHDRGHRAQPSQAGEPLQRRAPDELRRSQPSRPLSRKEDRQSWILRPAVNATAAAPASVVHPFALAVGHGFNQVSQLLLFHN